MTTECLQPVGGTVARAIKLDACGNVLTGVGSCQVVTEGFVSVERTAEYADPDQFVVKNWRGKVCLKERTAPQLLWYGYAIQLCEVDVDMYSLMTGNPVVTDDAIVPNNIGISTRTSLMGTSNFSLELWLPLSGEPCSPSGAVPYLYYVAPWIKQGTVSTPLTINNGPANFGIQGAISGFPSLWGTGPFNVQINTLAVNSKLYQPIASDEPDRWFKTFLPPPTAACGCTQVTPDA